MRIIVNSPAQTRSGNYHRSARDGESVVGSESRIPPKRINVNPTPTRLSTFSLKTTHAIVAVATASRLSSREAALAGVFSKQTAKELARPRRPRGWLLPATAGLFWQAGFLSVECQWQCGACAGRRVPHRSPDRADRQSAPDWPTTRQAWRAAYWLRKAPLPRARWRCRCTDSISVDYSFLGWENRYVLHTLQMSPNCFKSLTLLKPGHAKATSQLSKTF